MQLISALRGAAAEVVTLDSAWREAESLGRVKVDVPYAGAVIYTVTIHFEVGLSWVWAKASHPNIVDALISAIAEARRLR